MTFIPLDADIDDALTRVTRLGQDLYDQNASGADSAWQNVSDLLGNITYPGSEGIRAGGIGFRRGLGASIPSLIKPAFDAVLLAYLLRAGSDATSPETGWEDLTDYWLDNSKTVQERAITIGAITQTSGGGTGNPTFRILSVDENGENVESIWPTTIRIEATSAQPETQVGQETLEFYQPPRIDLFSLEHLSDAPDPEEGGDGTRRRITLVNRDTNLLRDSSFEFNGATAAIGTLSNLGAWVDDDGASTAKIAIVDDGHRASTRERQNFNIDPLNNPAQQCVELDGTAGPGGDISISQLLRPLQRTTPYDYGVWAKNDGSATGTLRITVGDTVITKSVATIGTSFEFVGVTLGVDNWPNNFALGDNLKFQIETISLAAGTLRLDAAEMKPLSRVNGVWPNCQPGSTPITTEFEATWAFSIPSDSEIQKFVHWIYGEGFYLPSAAVPTVPDP